MQGVPFTVVWIRFFALMCVKLMVFDRDYGARLCLLLIGD